MLWIFDGLVVFFILLLGYNGFKKGLIEELGRLLGLVVAILLSISQSTFVSIKIDQFINADDVRNFDLSDDAFDKLSKKDFRV